MTEFILYDCILGFRSVLLVRLWTPGNFSGDDLTRKLINLDLNVEIFIKANEHSIWLKSNLNLSVINIDFSIMNEREHLRKIIRQFHSSRWVSPEDGFFVTTVFWRIYLLFALDKQWAKINGPSMGCLRWVTSKVGSGLVLTDEPLSLSVYLT